MRAAIAWSVSGFIRKTGGRALFSFMGVAPGTNPRPASIVPVALRKCLWINCLRAFSAAIVRFPETVLRLHPFCHHGIFSVCE